MLLFPACKPESFLEMNRNLVVSSTGIYYKCQIKNNLLILTCIGKKLCPYYVSLEYFCRIL